MTEVSLQDDKNRSRGREEKSTDVYPPPSEKGKAILAEIEWAFAMRKVGLGEDYVSQALEGGRLDPILIREAVLRGINWAKNQVGET